MAVESGAPAAQSANAEAVQLGWQVDSDWASMAVRDAMAPLAWRLDCRYLGQIEGCSS